MNLLVLQVPSKTCHGEIVRRSGMMLWHNRGSRLTLIFDRPVRCDFYHGFDDILGFLPLSTLTRALSHPMGEGMYEIDPHPRPLPSDGRGTKPRRGGIFWQGRRAAPSGHRSDDPANPRAGMGWADWLCNARLVLRKKLNFKGFLRFFDCTH